MEFKDYYKILGVDADADAKQIKTAYRKLARKYHPDMNPDAGAEDKFKEVAEAYEVLKDAGRRAEFDELRKYGGRPGGSFEPPPGWQSSRGAQQQGGAQFDGDFSDFFNSIFGGGQAQESRQRHARGRDVEIELPIFLEETLNEFTKTVAFAMPQPDGTQANKQLKVKIPQGVTEGERIRLKGQGLPGDGNGAAGDLYLHVRLVPHPLFDVEGHNLLLTLPLAPWEAALGTKVTVPTLAGNISLTITPHSQSGKKLRIKGKGLQGKNITGDLLAVIKIVMPPGGSAKADSLWRELAETAAFDPRSEWSKPT